MKDNQQEIKEQLSSIQKAFFELVKIKPNVVLDALSENDMIKALAWNDSIRNGGKLGYRPIAAKYKVTEDKIRWILKTIQERKQINNA
jgi:hypothetical protein